MIHGRFQPFHLGHLEYLRGAAARSDHVYIGITNPDASHIREEHSDQQRHLLEANPFHYWQRQMMVDAVVMEESIPASIVPFPIDMPELWDAYVPREATQYLRVFSAWGATKLERLRSAGYEVVVLDERRDKEISGVNVRAALRLGGDWQRLVPQSVAHVINQLDISVDASGA